MSHFELIICPFFDTKPQKTFCQIEKKGGMWKILQPLAAANRLLLLLVPTTIYTTASRKKVDDIFCTTFFCLSLCFAIPPGRFRFRFLFLLDGRLSFLIWLQHVSRSARSLALLWMACSPSLYFDKFKGIFQLHLLSCLKKRWRRNTAENIQHSRVLAYVHR